MLDLAIRVLLHLIKTKNLTKICITVWGSGDARISAGEVDLSQLLAQVLSTVGRDFSDSGRDWVSGQNFEIFLQKSSGFRDGIGTGLNTNRKHDFLALKRSNFGDNLITCLTIFCSFFGFQWHLSV